MAIDRIIQIIADGEQLFDGCRIHTTSKSTMTCVPDVTQIDIIGATAADQDKIKQATSVTVYGTNRSSIGYGTPESVYVHYRDGKQVTSILLQDSGDIWRARSSVSIGAGMTKREIADLILLHSDSTVKLQRFPDDTSVSARGMTVHGRTIDALADIAKSCKARLWTHLGALRATLINDPTQVTTLRDDDLTQTPAAIDRCAYILQTDVIGVPVGSRVSVRTEAFDADLLVVSRSIDADSMQGAWIAQVIAIDTSSFDGVWEG